MRCKILLALMIVPLAAQIQVQVHATATQALLNYTAPDGSPCSVQVIDSESNTTVDDVNPLLFTGADLDSGRNILPSGQPARLVRVGLRTSALALDGKWHSRALPADSPLVATVTCGSQTGSQSFVTAAPVGIAPEAPPTDPAAWGQLAYPEFTDFSKPVVDPRTGLKFYSADPKAWSSSAPVAATAGWWSGGSGWANLANIGAYGTATARTGNTTAAVVYFDGAAFNDQTWNSGGYWPYDNFLDLGIDLYGSGTDANGANRAVNLCLSLDSGQTCYTSNVAFVLPAGAKVNAGTVPASYPSAYFGGWSKAIPRNAWPRRGSVTATAGVVTLTKNPDGTPLGTNEHDVTAYFNQDWAAGTRIFITGSGATCANSLCTIGSVQSATQLTLVENLTLPENPYRSANLAVIVQKTTATGTIDLSARFHVAKGYNHDLWTGGFAPNPVTSGDGIVGYPAIFPKTRQDAGGLYFVGVSKPVIRLVSLFVNHGCTNTTASDCPNGAISLLGPTTPQFDPNDSTIMYVVKSIQGGGPQGIFKVKYTGNWSALNTAYQSTSITPVTTTELTWTNLTPASTNQDPRHQILANTSYSEAQWSNLSSLQSAGTTGPYGIFYQTAGSQNTACWIFAFSLSTGSFYRAWRTDDGSTNDALHFAGCHAILPIEGGAVFISNNNLNNSNSAVPLGGPFVAAITGVRRLGVYSATTALPWPPDNTYDNACPAGLPVWVTAHGAINNQCAYLQMPQPCSAFPAANDPKTCPTDGTKGFLGNWQVGDFFKDPACGYDCEGLMIVALNPDGPGTYAVQRNANFSYCAVGNATSNPPKDGLGNPAQNVHANGWTVHAVARDSCYSSSILLDLTANIATVFNQNITRGHFDLSGLPGKIVTMIGSGSQDSSGSFQYPVQFQRPWANIGNASDWQVPQGPKFAGYQSDHDTQSYIDAKQLQASPELLQFAFDFRHYDPSLGVDLERPSQSLGGPTNLALQAGTTSVYKLLQSGTIDIKHQPLHLWAGEKYLIEQSSAATGNTLTAANPWAFCYSYRPNECRAGAAQGDLYAVLPRIDAKPQCWASQVNLRVPCAMSGPTQAMQITQVYVAGPDGGARRQRWLGSGLMTPPAQYVYSKVLPTPDGSYLMIGGFLLSGYHSGLIMAKLPPFPAKSLNGATYHPVVVKGIGASAYVEFGYEEFGDRSAFYCSARQETCRVASGSINETNPFSYTQEAIAPVSGPYTIAIPAIPGRILYYRVVDGGVPGPLRAVIPR